MQPLLDNPHRSTLRPGLVGPGRGPIGSWPGTPAGTDRGSSHEHRDEARQREAIGSRRSPHRGVRVPVRLPHRRPGVPGRRSTGCACPASTRPACSARCSTGRAQRSGSGRSASTFPRPLHGRDQRARHHLAHTERLGRGDRRAHHGPPRRGRRDHAAPGHRPTAARPHARAHRPLHKGAVEMELVCEPVFDYAHHRRVGAGGRRPARRGRLRRGRDGPPGHRHGPRPGGRSGARHALWPRASVFYRGPRREPRPGDAADAEARLATTVRYWRKWLDGARMPDHRWRRPIQRSAWPSRA